MFVDVLREPEVWREDPPVRPACNIRTKAIEWWWLPEAPTERIAEIRRYKMKWDVDRAEAKTTVAILLNLEPREWRSYIAAHTEARRTTVADVILESADAIRHLPVRMHELTSIAVEVIAQLKDDDDHSIAVRRARGAAWRYHAVALEGLTRYRDALDACDRADEELSRVSTLGDERAAVAYVRGTVLTRLGRLDDALPHVRLASHIYREYGDKPHYVKSRVLEGYVLHKAQRNAETLALWTSLIADARAIKDHETLASLHLNIGTELRNQREFDRAIWYLRAALRMFTRQRMISEIPRARLSLARTRVLRSEYAAAVQDLWKVYGEFADLRMHMAAANVRLEIVEVLLILGRHKEAHRICVGLPEIYLEGEMPENALQAAAFLRECAEAGDVQVADVQHVRLFLQDLPQNPTKAFAAQRGAGR